jgi:hypothetical protein
MNPIACFLYGIYFTWRTQLSDFNDFFVWVLLIIMKRLSFYVLSLIPLVIMYCLSSRPRAETMVVSSVFKDL